MVRCSKGYLPIIKIDPCSICGKRVTIKRNTDMNTFCKEKVTSNIIISIEFWSNWEKKGRTNVPSKMQNLQKLLGKIYDQFFQTTKGKI